MDPTVRLRIATRIHFALLRHFGEDVRVSVLLRGGDAAKEALWVCEASPHPELVALGRQLSDMLKEDAAMRAEEVRRSIELQNAAPQDAAWSRDTSGFGVSRPGDLPEPAAEATSAWFNPARWLRRGSARSPR